MKGCWIGAGITITLALSALLLAVLFRKKLDRQVYGNILLGAVNLISLSVVFAMCAASLV